MKRNDAVQIFDIPVYNRIFPFMFKRRCDSLVYHAYKLDVSETVKFIREYNSTKPEMRLKFFYVFCAALIRTFAIRPELNRFISNSRYWQRNDLSMNFVVKEDFTNESPETSTPLYFKPEMTLFEYAKIIDDYIKESRNKDKSSATDNTLNLLKYVPTWLLRLIVKIMGAFDKHGKCPQFIRDIDGLHTSVFLSSLGSIGIIGGSPLHHLYEWGTTSVFVTIGGMERKREFDQEGKLLESKEFVEIGATLDERISSGFYFIKSMHVLQDLLSNPQKLLERPELPPRPLTKKEYRKKLREQRKLMKQALLSKTTEQPQQQ